MIRNLRKPLPNVGKYRFIGNTYLFEVKKNKEDRLELEIGDQKQQDFLPQAKLKRWDNEVNFSARLKDSRPIQGQVTVENDVIKWNRAGREARFYEKPASQEYPEGALEIEVLLTQKPTSNVLEYTIETKGLEFFYQGPLTPQELAEGIRRAENAQGSYAVYYEGGKSGDYSQLGGKNYKTGKAFHIYRPKIIDANGKECWGELNIDLEKKLLTVTIPQDFLNSAVYPILVDPTIGYATIGSSSASGNTSRFQGSRWAGADGKVDDIRWYGSVGAGNGVGMALYKGSDLNKLADSELSLSGAQSLGWHTYTYSTRPTIAASENYWIMLNSDGSSSAAHYWDTTGGTGKTKDTQFTGSMAADISSGFTDNAYRYSTYITYTAEVTVNDSRSAKITGARHMRVDQVAITFSGTGGGTANSERAAKITGKAGATSERQAKITGKVSITSERPAKITGKATTSSERAAKVTGGVSVTDERAAKTTGKQATSAERPAKITGFATTAAEREAKITGKALISSERDAKVTGKTSATSERPAKITGKAQTSAERAAKVTGKAQATSERAAKTAGKVTTFSEIAAKITGFATAFSERAAKIVGLGGEVSERAAKIVGKAQATAERAAKILGKVSQVSERLAKIIGKQFTTEERQAKIRGKLDTTAERQAKITGKVTTAEERQAKVTGKDSAASERQAKITGKVEITDERSAKIHGKDAAQSERPAKITGKAATSDSRQAKIVGYATAFAEYLAKIVGKLGANAERAAKIVGSIFTTSERSATIHGKADTTDERQAKVTGINMASSERPAKIHGKAETADERAARLHGFATASSERGASITGKITKTKPIDLGPGQDIATIGAKENVAIIGPNKDIIDLPSKDEAMPIKNNGPLDL